MTYFNRLILTSLLVGSTFVVSACGPSSGHANPGDLDAYISQFADALCKLDVACGNMPDLPTCMASLQYDSTELATLRADIASGKVRFDTVKAGACIDYVKRFYGGACTRTALSGFDTDSGSEACDQFLVGSVAEGGACFSAFECASATCTMADTACSRSRACCAGTCDTKPTPIAVGGDCSAPQPGQGCATGAVCVSTGSGTSRICQVPSQVAGAPCATLFDCEPPLFCAQDTAGGTGTCQSPAATGAACNTVVSFGSCDDLRDYCDTTTAKCTRRAPVGAACDVAQSNCIYYASCLGGTCVAMSPDRGACNTTDGPSCLGDLECSPTTFTCGFPDFVRTACN